MYVLHPCLQNKIVVRSSCSIYGSIYTYRRMVRLEHTKQNKKTAPLHAGFSKTAVVLILLWLQLHLVVSWGGLFSRSSHKLPPPSIPSNRQVRCPELISGFKKQMLFWRNKIDHKDISRVSSFTLFLSICWVIVLWCGHAKHFFCRILFT